MEDGKSTRNIAEYLLEIKHRFAHLHIAFKNKPVYFITLWSMKRSKQQYDAVLLLNLSHLVEISI